VTTTTEVTASVPDTDDNRRLRRRWLRDIAAVKDIEQLDPEQVRSVIDDDERRLAIYTLRAVAKKFDRWLERASGAP
jgi:hypothetical protein